MTEYYVHSRYKEPASQLPGIHSSQAQETLSSTVTGNNFGNNGTVEQTMPYNKKNAQALSDRALELVMRDVLEGMRARSLQGFGNKAHSPMKITDPVPEAGSRLYATRPHSESSRKLQETGCRKLNS